jgi:hypothetical protein
MGDDVCALFELDNDLPLAACFGFNASNSSNRSKRWSLI